MLDPQSSVPFESVSVIMAAALMTSGLALVPIIIQISKHWIPERNQFFARWGFTHAATVVLVGLASMLLIPLIWSKVAGDMNELLSSLLRMALIFLGPALVIFRFARRLDPDRERCLGFRADGSLRALSFGLSSYLLLLPALVGVMLLWPWVLNALGGEATAQESVRGFLELDRGRLVLPLVLAIVVLPFFEELIFRAFLQPLFVQNFREVGGVAITSLLFASLHGLSVFLPVFVLSLIMGGVMLRTQRFVSCWAVHAAHNGLTIAGLLFLPAMEEFVNSQGLLSSLLF